MRKPPGDRSADLLIEFDEELQEGRIPNWSSYLGRCGTKAERMKLLDDMLSVEVERVGWKTNRVKSRLRLLEKHGSSHAILVRVIRGLYGDRLKAGERPEFGQFRSLGISADQLRLRAEGESVFLGCTVGRHYQLDKLLGVGGFGVVYRARDRSRRRLVAVKAINGQSRAEKRKARKLLIEEGKVLRELSHRRIPKLIDSVDAGDASCLVLEYLGGGTLQCLVRPRGILPKRAATIVAAIADTLDFAHRKGYTHRDLKPANVLLDRHERPYLADFGLALPRKEQFDRDGEWVSSPGYTAVESALGATRQIDGRADIFSAGVVLYELLTGKALLSHMSREWSFVDAFLVERRRLWFPRGTPLRLKEICQKCLPFDPNNRYHTAALLRDDLLSFLNEGARHGQKTVAANK